MTDPKDPSLVPNDNPDAPPTLSFDLVPDTTLAMSTTLTIAKTPIRDLRIGDRTYRPQPDVTPHELAMMFMLFAAGGSLVCAWDFEAFILENGLERHWPKEK